MSTAVTTPEQQAGHVVIPVRDDPEREPDHRNQRSWPMRHRRLRRLGKMSAHLITLMLQASSAAVEGLFLGLLYSGAGVLLLMLFAAIVGGPPQSLFSTLPVEFVLNLLLLSMIIGAAITTVRWCLRRAHDARARKEKIGDAGEGTDRAADRLVAADLIGQSMINWQQGRVGQRIEMLDLLADQGARVTASIIPGDPASRGDHFVPLLVSEHDDRMVCMAGIEAMIRQMQAHRAVEGRHDRRQRAHLDYDFRWDLRDGPSWLTASEAKLDQLISNQRRLRLLEGEPTNLLGPLLLDRAQVDAANMLDRLPSEAIEELIDQLLKDRVLDGQDIGDALARHGGLCVESSERTAAPWQSDLR